MNDSKYGHLYPERAVAPLRQLAQDFVMGERVLVEDFQRAVEALDSLGFPPDEPLFLLRGQDELAPETVRHYARLVYDLDAFGGDDNNDRVIDHIRAFADLMETWKPRKLPD